MKMEMSMDDGVNLVNAGRTAFSSGLDEMINFALHICLNSIVRLRAFEIRIRGVDLAQVVRVVVVTLCSKLSASRPLRASIWQCRFGCLATRLLPPGQTTLGLPV